MTDSTEPEVLPPEGDSSSSSFYKPFLDHLEDLRFMLIKMAVTVVVVTLLAFIYAKELLAVIMWPLKRVNVDPSAFLFTFEVTGGFSLAMKLSLYASLVLSCPLLLVFLAQFIVPALTSKERSLLTPVFVSGVFLFLCGVALAYFVVIPTGLEFFLKFNENLGIRSQWVIENYASFVSHMCLAFGLCFELPLVVLALAKLELVTANFLRQKRSYFIVAIFFMAAIVTPTTDPLNQSLLAAPMVILYEVCIWITWFMERARKRKA